MAVRIKDVAEYCGVSAGAVSQVIRDHDHSRIPEKTRKRIMDAVESLGYRPNNLSVGLRRKRSDLLSLIIPWNNPELMDTVEQEAYRHGFRVMVNFTTHPDASREISNLDYALDWHVDGIIWLPFSNIENYPERLLNRLQNSNVKIVFLQRRLPELPGILVGTDYRQGIKKLTAHIAPRYRKIIYLTGGSPFETKNQRKNYLMEELKNYDVKYEAVTLETEANGYAEAIAPLLKKRQPYPIALVCDIDWIGLDALNIARQLNLTVPDQVGIVTIGDHLIGGIHRVSDLTYPRLSALRVDYHQQGVRAVQNIVKMINNEEGGQDVLLPLPLIVNESINRGNK